jgi:regulator of sigma D
MFSIFKRPHSRPQASVFPNAAVPVRPAATTRPPAWPQPSTQSGGIAYDPQLVDRLKEDHQEMIAIYTRLLKAAQAEKPASIPEDLVLFRRVFQGHILMESVRFYVYLDRLLANDESVRDEARAVRKDMNGIARAVAEFIHNWITVPIDAATLPLFTEQLQGIGAALVARVELEESRLYTLYTETL